MSVSDVAALVLFVTVVVVMLFVAVTGWMRERRFKEDMREVRVWEARADAAAVRYMQELVRMSEETRSRRVPYDVVWINGVMQPAPKHRRTPEAAS